MTCTTTAPFVMTPIHLLQQCPEMKADHAWCCMILKHFARDNDRCWPSLRQIADLMHRSTKFVSRVLAEIQSLGYVKIEGRREKGGARSNIYRLSERFRSLWPVARAAAKTVDKPESRRPAGPPPPVSAKGKHPVSSAETQKKNQGAESGLERGATLSERAAAVVKTCREALPRLRRGPDTSTPAARFEVFRQRCMSWAAERWAPDRIAAAWGYLIEHDGDMAAQRRFLNPIDEQMRAAGAQ